MRTFFPMSDGAYGEWEMTPLNILAMMPPLELYNIPTKEEKCFFSFHF